MRLFGIKCEMCSLKHMQSGDMWHHETKIPHGWLLVYNGDKGTPQDIEPYHFCSFECLRSWAEQAIHTEGASIKVKTALL